MRLDKYLSDMGLASRSDIKKEIRKGLVLVNGEIIRDSSFSVPLHASVSYRGEEVCYEEFSYYMMNKPIGENRTGSDYGKTQKRSFSCRKTG